MPKKITFIIGDLSAEFECPDEFPPLMRDYLNFKGMTFERAAEGFFASLAHFIIDVLRYGEPLYYCARCGQRGRIASFSEQPLTMNSIVLCERCVKIAKANVDFILEAINAS